ncbi:hypothetical protein C8R46DRAFT_1219758 [Mycena filopes]|nr:hypothetical protein C8R46DRAFT_1219758 [Mycena filopes]
MSTTTSLFANGHSTTDLSQPLLRLQAWFFQQIWVRSPNAASRIVYLVNFRNLRLPGLVSSYAPSNSASAFKLQLFKSDFSALTGPQLRIGSTSAPILGLISTRITFATLLVRLSRGPFVSSPTLRHSWNELRLPVDLQSPLNAAQFELIRNSGASTGHPYRPNKPRKAGSAPFIDLWTPFTLNCFKTESIPIVSLRPERPALYLSSTLKALWTPFDLRVDSAFSQARQRRISTVAIYPERPNLHPSSTFQASLDAVNLLQSATSTAHLITPRKTDSASLIHLHDP